jgi:SAM-dependent methyltransferase
MRGYYNSYAGQVYFERMGQTLPAEAIGELHNLVNVALQTLQQPTLRWLDLGCGNGRHLAHLHKFMPNVQLQGLELSDLGVELCKKLESSERLPVGCVSQGDMRLIPYKADSFDVVYARLSLQALPLLGSLPIGLRECLDEVKRILKPRGLFIAICPRGSGFDYKLPFQYLNPTDLVELFKPHWQLIKDHSVEWQKLSTGQSHQRKTEGEFTFVWQKLGEQKP